MSRAASAPSSARSDGAQVIDLRTDVSHGPVLDVLQLGDDELRMWMRTLGVLLRRDVTAPGLRAADDPVRRHRLTEELGRLAAEARRRRVDGRLATG
jgi:hypothetical protein